MMTIILFMVFTLALLIGSAIYVSWMLTRLFDLRNAKILYIFFAAGIVSLPVSRWLLHKISNGMVDIYFFISTVWLGFFIYLFLLLICFYLINIFIKLPKKTSGFIIVGLSVLISGYALWNAYSVKTVRIEIPIKGLKEEVKIVLLADIHLGAHRKGGYLEKVVAQTNNLEPDLILLPGDIVDSNTALDGKTLEPLKKLRGSAYFVTGNHDTYVNTERLFGMLKKNKIRILHNQVINTHNLQLIGLDYMNADEKVYDMHPSKDKRTIKEVLQGLEISPDQPIVLMHHSPVGVEYVNARSIDLMLSGHTHGGGQIFPFTLIANFLFPYKNGLYDYKGTAVYVSQGVGTFYMPMRLGTANEITLIRLKPKKK